MQKFPVPTGPVKLTTTKHRKVIVVLTSKSAKATIINDIQGLSKADIVISFSESTIATNITMQRLTNADNVMSIGEDESKNHFLIMPPGEEVIKVSKQFISRCS